VSLCLTEHRAKKTYWSSGSLAPRILYPLILDGDEWSASLPGTLYPGTHWIGRWSRTGLERFEDHLCPRPQGARTRLAPWGQPIDPADSPRKIHHIFTPLEYIYRRMWCRGMTLLHIQTCKSTHKVTVFMTHPIACSCRCIHYYLGAVAVLHWYP
jgi:hypothetical protein